MLIYFLFINQCCFVFKVIFVGLLSCLLIFILKLCIHSMSFLGFFVHHILHSESTMNTAVFWGILY